MTGDMPGSDELRILGFEKKGVSWDLDLDGVSWFSELTEVRPVWVYGMPVLWLSQWVVSWRCPNSQHGKKLCLSLLMSENFKLKKVNKWFVPEPISCFSDSYMRMNIMNVLCMWISWSYFWTNILHYKDEPKLFAIFQPICVSYFKYFYSQSLFYAGVDSWFYGRTMFCRQCICTFAWLLFNNFNQKLFLHNGTSLWPYFGFEAQVTFLETSESVLYQTFVDSSWKF